MSSDVIWLHHRSTETMSAILFKIFLGKNTYSCHLATQKCRNWGKAKKRMGGHRQKQEVYITQHGLFWRRRGCCLDFQVSHKLNGQLSKPLKNIKYLTPKTSLCRLDSGDFCFRLDIWWQPSHQWKLRKNFSQKLLYCLWPRSYTGILDYFNPYKSYIEQK